MFLSLSLLYNFFRQAAPLSALAIASSEPHPMQYLQFFWGYRNDAEYVRSVTLPSTRNLLLMTCFRSRILLVTPPEATCSLPSPAPWVSACCSCHSSSTMKPATHTSTHCFSLSLRYSPILITAHPSSSSSLWQVSMCVYPLFGSVRDPAEHPLILLLSSVRLYAWKTREPLNGFSWNSVADSCNEFADTCQFWLKSNTNMGCFAWSASFWTCFERNSLTVYRGEKYFQHKL